jgi:hypothetical protein
MKKIRRAEWLAAVAIITSATVLQIREHMLVHAALPATPEAAQTSCDMPRSGLVLAACEPTRGEAPASRDQNQNQNQNRDRATRHLRTASKIWV